MARYRPAVAMLLMILATLLLAAQPSSANRRAWRNGGRFQPLDAPASGGNGGNGGSGSVYIVRLSSAPPLVEYRGGIAGYPATATWDDGRDANDGADDDESVPKMDLAATDVATGADAASLRAAKHEAEDATTPAPPRSAAAADDDAAPSRAVKQTVPLPYWDGDWSFFYSEPNATAPAPAGATGSGGGNGNGGRAARRRMRLSMDRPQVAAFATLLQRQQAQVASEAGVLDSNLIYSYKHTSNGFAARLTARQVWRLQRHPDVASVTPSRMFSVQTTDSPKFLVLPGKVWPAVGGQSKAGDGIVVGIIDSGIWPEHPSFGDAGMSSKLPSGWKGKCEQSSSFRCNNKVIGARAFYAAFGSPSLQKDWLSPRDSSGHGTWCAGAAGGNPVSINGAGVIAAVNQAVADGVDVLSLSLGGLGANQDYFGDLVYLRANATGVFVAMSAGNSGAPGRLQGGIYRTVANFSPFVLTVGASRIAVAIHGTMYHWCCCMMCMTQPASFFPSPPSTLLSQSALHASFPIRPPRFLPNPPSTLLAQSALHASFPIRPPRFFPNPPSTLLSQSALHASFPIRPPRFFPNPPSTLLSQSALHASFPIRPPRFFPNPPSTLLSHSALHASFPIPPPCFPFSCSTIAKGASLAAARTTNIASATGSTNSSNSMGDSGATLTADGGITFTAASSDPRVADISSRGPLLPPNATTRPPLPANDILKPDIIGPGVDLVAAAPSKKIEKDYQNFLAGQDLNRAKKEFPGASLSPLAVRNLNLPTITLARLQGSLQVTRTVTCVGSSVSTYTVSGSPSQGVRVFVGPGRFTLSPGQKANYTLIATVVTPSNGFKYGFIVWKDDKGHSVRSPLVVQPISR
ncbi:unnamed protein product [Closterium sp. NIES-65]|nr:unnamed protein product [Closterium sp. NIES-65]